MAESPIDVKSVKQALLRSGYLLESRIETLLLQEGYNVETNYPYPDPITNISRELDVHATTLVSLNVPKSLGVFGTLLIECVNNPQPIALISKEWDEEASEVSSNDEIKLSGLPAKLIVSSNPERWVALTKFLELQKHHHYYAGRIASQFCSFVQKKSGQSKGEWMASHDDGHFDAFRKLSDVVEYEIDRFYKAWLGAENRHVNLEFFYPIVVVQGDLLDVRATKRSVRLIKANYLRFKRSCVSGAQRRVYMIDVVRESFFKKYLGLVQSEINHVGRRIEDHKQLVNLSLDKIVDQVLSLPSEKKRHAAESPWFRSEI